MTERKSVVGSSRAGWLLKRKLSFIFGLLFVMAFMASPCLASSGSPGGVGEVDLTRHPRYKTRIKRKWGIEVASIRRVAVGYMLAFRYRVIDEEKAKPVFLRRHKPRLIHEATGAEFIVPAPQKTGPLRNSNMPQEGRIYWMMFANPARFIQPGDKVTIVIGDFRAEHLVVEEFSLSPPVPPR